MRHSSGLAFAMFGMMVAASAVAGGMKMEPGKWEFKSTSDMAMMGGPREVVTTQCIDDDEVTPNQFIPNAKDCEMTNVEVGAASMSWQMKCTTPGGTMTGKGELEARGPKATGSMTMNMSFNGQQMSFKRTWVGKRLGPCDG